MPFDGCDGAVRADVRLTLRHSAAGYDVRVYAGGGDRRAGTVAILPSRFDDIVDRTLHSLVVPTVGRVRVKGIRVDIHPRGRGLARIGVCRCTAY